MTLADPVRPEDCTLLVGIPTTADAFLAAVADKRSGQRDFACAARFGGVAGYRTEVIAPFERARRRWARCGARVVEQATRASVREHLHDRARRVVIVLTHFLGDRVELFDGLVDCEDFARLVPSGHGGVIDLCMCRPMPLVNSIKRAAPAAHVRFASASLTPALWFDFYERLFRLLRSQPINYIDAVERTSMALVRQGATA